MSVQRYEPYIATSYHEGVHASCRRAKHGPFVTHEAHAATVAALEERVAEVIDQMETDFPFDGNVKRYASALRAALAPTEEGGRDA